LGVMLMDPKKGTGGKKEPCKEPPAAPSTTGRRAGLWRPASCCHVLEAWAVRCKASSVAEPKSSPGTTGRALSVLLQGLVKDDCSSHTWRRAWTSVESVRPSGQRDASNKL
ncbi:hypothetical protein GOODEAATRI_022703, partial [Goodea atripinnis]